MATITKKRLIEVETVVKAPVDKVWEYWTTPNHITQWYNASDEWHAPAAENDLRVDGKFKITMAAKDGSKSFDFEGKYNDVRENEKLVYTIDDGRKVEINFSDLGDKTKVVEKFEGEKTHPIEIQKGGWQSILNNFKKYTEAN